MSETNSYMDENVRHAIWMFGQDEEGLGRHNITVCPSGAALLYWALRELVMRTGGSVRSLVVNRDYPAALQGHAAVVEWCHNLQAELVEFVRENGKEVGRCR